MGGRKLAIVGAGSAGLISLYYAVRRLPDWQITCFEKTGAVTGVWGFPYRGFVSTSTKYTTQFSCHRKFDATADPEGDRQRADFFRDGEYGAYLESFVREKQLAPFIEHHSDVRRVERVGDRWRLTVQRTEVTASALTDETFDAVILCTGLAERPKEIACDLEQLFAFDEAEEVTGRRIVVVGGGESAVDIANRLAHPSLGNSVTLSIKTGIRVSPRYHPIKGVPSDFLRTRLLISIHEDIRNRVGQKFVEARIQHQERFERFFGSKKGPGTEAPSTAEKRKVWAAKLTELAKDSLFNMFHNKSDDFLDAVAEDRLRIVGPALDESYRTYADLEGGPAIHIDPDLLVPKIGFVSNLRELSPAVGPKDFYLGCVHADFDNLFLVGFARPILGNIPGINEIQAQYVTGLLEGRHRRPANLREAHRRDRERLEQAFPTLDTDNMVPVEMYPYCDRLARLMGTYPSLRRAGSLRSWLKIWLSPASTLQYLDENYDPAFLARQPVHSPAIVTGLLLLIKLFDIPYSRFRKADAQ